VRPNKPLNIVLGIILGCLAGLFMATLVYVLQRREFRRRSGTGRRQVPPGLRTVIHVTIALIVGVGVGYFCAMPMDLGSLFAIQLWLVLGGVAIALVELARVTPNPPSDPDPAPTREGPWNDLRVPK